MIQMLLCKYC